MLTSAIAWLSVQGDDVRALFNGRSVAIATHSGDGAHVVGRDSIAHLISRLNHLGVGPLVAATGG